MKTQPLSFLSFLRLCAVVTAAILSASSHQPLGAQTITITTVTSNAMNDATSLAIVDGQPAISFVIGGGDLGYVRGTDATGTSWGTPITVDSAQNAGLYNSLAVVSGNPAISYEGDSELRYARASDASGTLWGTPITVSNEFGSLGSSPFDDTSLAVVNGNPAISYNGYDGNFESFFYVRATNDTGTTWGSPWKIEGPDGSGNGSSLAVVNGVPAISHGRLNSGNPFNDGLIYSRAFDANGDPPFLSLDVDSNQVTNDREFAFTSLAIVDGNPAISYYDMQNDDLKYVRASDVDGETWGTPITIDSVGSVGEYTSLAVIGGKPAISYYDWTNWDLKYVQASDADGTSWGTPLTVDGTTDRVGEFTSLVELPGGAAGISYYSFTDQSLKFAVVVPEPASVTLLVVGSLFFFLGVRNANLPTANKTRTLR